MESKNKNLPEKIPANASSLSTEKRSFLEKSLAERLESVDLPIDEHLKIGDKEIVSTIVDTLVSFVPGADKAKRILETKEKIDLAIDAKKKELLIEGYLNKTDNHEKAILGIANMLIDIRGVLLYKKIESRMLSEIPSQETTEILSSTLKKVLDSDLTNEFDSHKAIVTTITRMDMKSLLILKDNNNWPIIRSKPDTMDSTDAPDISVDWAFRIAKEYLGKKGITDDAMVFHARTCFNELIQEGCIMAKSEINGNDFALITAFGDRVLEYIII